ncbi:hypothetical protein ABN151_12640 [Klebsiella oxytoca]|uniref:hypothetical protein n=1 Tax=Klebsiella oxytoca TaxID=571 RepID=UPI0032DB4FE5
MAELNPPLGTTSPPVFLLNVQNLDKAMNSSNLTWNDRGDIERDSWAGLQQKFLDALAVLAQSGGILGFETEADLLAYTPQQAHAVGIVVSTGDAWLWDGSAWASAGVSFAEKAVNKYIDNISAADSDTPVLTLGGAHGFSWHLLRQSGLYWKSIQLSQEELKNDIIDIRQNLLRAGGIEMSQLPGGELLLVGQHGFAKKIPLSTISAAENVESDALEHWIFGTGDAALTGRNGNHTLSPQNVTHAWSKNYVEIPAWGGALVSDVPDSLEYTRCAVVRYDGVKGVSVFNNSDYALSIGGGRFVITSETKTGDAMKVVCVEKGLDTQGWYIPASAGDWIFIALTERLSDTGASCTRSIFIGGQAPLDIREPDNKIRPLSTLPLAVGNAFSDNTNYKTNPLAVAETVVYDIALSPTELQALYERRKQAMAARGIRVF